MENMDKGLTVPKWVLIVRPKIPQMPQNLSAQFVCPSQKSWDFNEKRVLWASAVRAYREEYKYTNDQKVSATDFENSKTESWKYLIKGSKMNTS